MQPQQPPQQPEANPSQPQPPVESKVIHVRSAPGVTPQDIVQFLQQFGPVEYIVPLPKINQALVEFSSIEHARTAIQTCQENPISLHGKEIRIQYSKSQEIEKKVKSGISELPQNASHSEVEQTDEHVLFISVHNPLYPITMDALAKIFEPFQVQRIVIFQKNGVHALAEFPSPEIAANARNALDGKQMYANCCTLKIVFSKIPRLNVRYNNDKSMDFTQNLPAAPPIQPRPQPTPQLPLVHTYVQAPYPQYPTQGIYQPTPQPVSVPVPTGVASGPFPTGVDGLPVMGLGVPSRTVLIVYNLEERLTCDNIFNLFCIYGNVIKIKRLHLKPGVALVQMGDPRQAELARTCLNSAKLFRQRLEIQFSKHPAIKDPRDPPPGEDPQNPFTKDYSTSPLNRFRNPASTYNHRYKPTNVLFFSRAPISCTEQTLQELFTQAGVSAPTGIKFFDQPRANPSAKQPERPRNFKSGLIHFENPTVASEALCLVNHSRLDNSTLRLAFSMNQVFQS